MSRAALLDRLREVKGCSYVPEIELLRDVIYLLQGIGGTHVAWRKEQLRAHEAGALEQTPAREITRLVVNEDKGMIPAPVQDRIHRLAELGQLYVRVKEYVDMHAQSREARLSIQSLCHFLSGQLSEYYAMIAQLETRWHLLAEGDPNAEHFSLQALVKSTRESLLRMRLMSTIVESCRGTNGKNLVSTIHVYTQTGDPFIRDFTSTLLDNVSRPFFHCLSRWIYDGELNDPCGEFFVALQHNDASNSQQDTRRVPESELAVVDEQGSNAADVWHSKFILRKELIPSFLSEDFANKIFSTGRSLNFIRCSCGEDDWSAMHAKLHAIDRERTLRYSDMVGLEHTIDAVYAAASGHLVHTFLHRFRLRDHLRALKEYLMLTKGDFADALMTSLGPSLSRPAHTLYQHNLSAALETAIRTSNAQYDDPDILRRLDARSLEFNAGDTGWDSFTLEYRVESPVSAVLDASAMAGYQILFNYLWKIQRVESTVTASWESFIALQRTLLRAGQKRVASSTLLGPTRRVMMQLNEIIHFVRQLQGFCQLEVIAYSWHGLEHEFEHHPGGDLDQLIEAHRSYLHTLISNALLRGGKRGQLDHLADEVRAQLDATLLFCAGLDDLSRHVTTDLARIASGMVRLDSLLTM
ncbi:Microtubule-nucleating Tub4p (gamma-tubulin) complex component [Malassezia yamatoensis]|uniref:Microtubule-nucleating Tub4p (Gamma-tubulin) complex component n=1 Tax=Malassezia yamatoensis TaxID=253288 RepID=A0AAJ6CFS4_9BASI|nr:Microtubule-nucleating Tub4p (gamma-tubulin) complex component [Malassezia yamatoensis]